MTKRWKIGLLAWVAMCGVSLAQTAPNNEQLVQSFRALLSSGSDTQAVINAVANAVMEAMKQGPMTAAQVQQSSAMAPDPAPAAAPAVTPPKTWADSIVWKGDMRLREEYRKDRTSKDVNNVASDPNSKVDYDRFRARIGLESQVNDNVKVGVRLGTDSTTYNGDKAGVGGDPASNNQDMNNAASKKPIFLDLAYIDWNLFGPDNSELHFIGGKMNNPFITMNDDLVWDPDITPEGFALKGVYDLSPVTLLGNLGYIVVANQNSINAPNNQVVQYGAQGAVKYEFCPEVSMTLGISDYYFQQIKGSSVAWVDVLNKSKSTTFYGNDVTASGSSTNFNDGFDVIQPFVSLDMFPTVCGHVVPVSVYAQGVRNVLASNLANGEMYGFTLGKAKNTGTCEFGATYAKLQRDATLGEWTDSDRWGGGTDGDGYKLYLKYMLLKNLAAQVTFYDDKKGIQGSANGTGYERYAFDLVASF